MYKTKEETEKHERLANRLIWEMVGLCKKGEIPTRDIFNASGILYEGSDPYVQHLKKGRVTLPEFARLVRVPKKQTDLVVRAGV